MPPPHRLTERLPKAETNGASRKTMAAKKNLGPAELGEVFGEDDRDAGEAAAGRHRSGVRRRARREAGSDRGSRSTAARSRRGRRRGRTAPTALPSRRCRRSRRKWSQRSPPRAALRRASGRSRTPRRWPIATRTSSGEGEADRHAGDRWNALEADPDRRPGRAPDGGQQGEDADFPPRHAHAGHSISPLSNSGEQRTRE